MKMLLLALLLVTQRPTSPPLRVGTVTGRLLNEDGSPAAKIRVSAMAIPQSGNEAPTLITLAETDNTGRYRLADVPVGRYYIVAGFVDSPTYYPRGTGPGGATPVNVTANAIVANIDFRIEKPSAGVTVSGRVIADSTPSFGAVQIMLSGGGNTGYTNVNLPAKLDGSFEFVRVRPGTYSLSVNPSPVPESKTVTVGDKDVTGLELRIPWTTEVAGRVVVEGDGPSPTLNMSFSGGSRVVNAYHQGANQSFRATLAEGFYVYTIANLPSGYFLKSVISGATDLLSSPLRISRAESTPEVVVTLGVSNPPPWIKLSGRVTGSRQAGMGLSLHGPGGTLMAPLAADGSFEFSKILPGSYTVQITPGTPLTARQMTLIVPNRDVSGVELSLPVLKEISGRVVVENGAPLPRPTLTLSVATEELAASSTPPSLAQLLVTTPNSRGTPLTVPIAPEADGSFKSSLPVGRYTATASILTNGGPAPYTVKSFTYGSVDLTKEPLTLSSIDSGELRLTFSPTSTSAWVKVSGRVVGLRASSPLQAPPVTVWLNSNSSLSPLTAVVRTDGTFEFPKVYSGNYHANLNGVTSGIGIPGVEVNVGSTDVTGVEFVVPAQKEITGRIILEGRGALPRLSLPLTVASGTSGFPGGQMTYLNINPLPDGTFKVIVPEGERQVGRPNSIPAGYTLKSVQYGSTDLAGNPLRVSAADTAELRVTLATPDLPPVKVSGKVSGVDAATFSRGPVSINLNEPRYVTPFQAPVSPDGSFEFLAVFPGTYTVGVSAAASYNNVNIQPINVGSKDVTGVEITVPRQKEITGRIVLEGSGPMPRFTLPMNVASGAGNIGFTLNMSITPQADGTFRATVQEGERRVGAAGGLPAGYTIKAMTYGTVDVLSAPMKVTTNETAELRIMVSTPNASPVTVSGKVTGLDAAMLSRGPVNVSMNAPGYAGTFQTNVSSEGSFQFPEVFPGNYSARVTGAGIAPHQPATIAVLRADVANVEIILPGQKEITGRVVVEGSGPMPRFNFRPAQSAIAQGGSLGLQVINIAPAANGNFRVTLPEGQRPLGEIMNLPPGYALKAATYGTTNLMSDPLKISKTDTGELVFTLSASALKPVSVSGKVEGLEGTVLTQGVARVVLVSPNYAGNVSTAVRPDGTFELAAVFPGSHIAQIIVPTLIGGAPITGAAFNPAGTSIPLPSANGVTPGVAAVGSPSVPITVTDNGIRDLNLSMPRQYPIVGRIEIPGGGPIPRLGLTFSALAASQIDTVAMGTTTAATFGPQPDGTFRFSLPEGERMVRVGQLPPGLVLESITFGAINLQESPLKVGANQPAAELRITLVKTQPVPWVRVSGKVTGLPAEVRNARVNLNGTFAMPQTVPLNSDGTFTFTDVFQGPASIRLIGNLGEGLQPPVTITVGSKDVTDLELVYRR